MPLQNAEIARILSRLADLLEMESGNEFRVRAYRNAARSIADFHRNLVQMVADGEDLAAIPAVGKGIAGKIAEVVQTDNLAQLRELEKRYPPQLLELERIAGLGAKRVSALYHALGITTVEGLRKAAEEGKIRELPGFGAKTEQNILESIARMGPRDIHDLLRHG